MQFQPRRVTFAALSTGLVAALVASTVGLAPTATAAPGDTGLVINEVFGNGGATGATWKSDFVELANPSSEEIDLDGLTVQYRSASSSSTPSGSNVVALSGAIPAGGTYLVGGASGANGADLPSPDVTSGVNLSTGSGRVAIVDDVEGYAYGTGSVTSDPKVLDLVGYGPDAATFETAIAPTLGGTGVHTSLNRAAAADTDDNSADLSLAAPSPTACGDACDGGGSGGVLTIAEIQGTTNTSPEVGSTVTTAGVVTATYPTGGFDGFYIQTEGTGGDVDPATHTASDGIFVYDAADAAAVDVGDFVEVTGEVEESNNLTRIVPDDGGVTDIAETADAVTPATVEVPTDLSGREAFEGMLLAPTGEFTVTNNYATHQYGEVGLAIGDQPLQTPTNVVAPDDDPSAPGSAYDDLVAYNAGHLITLDDGSSLSYTGSASGTPMAWLSPANEVRVGATATLVDPMVLDYRFGWKLQPTQRLTGGNPGAEPATFSSTRPAAPEAVGGDISLATFNVLNYFTTLGKDVDGCTAYLDRQSYPTTVDSCPGNGPRGAWDAQNLERQEAKIVHAINGLDADVVSLEEIENNLATTDGGADRDAALATLVDALNEDAGAGTWDFVRSPDEAALPDDEDVIRTAFIYQPATVAPVGDAVILDDPAFANARQPLAQDFAPVGAVEDDAFLVIVNHFKSKGSGSGADADQHDGQGSSNFSRTQQAEALVAFAADLEAEADTDNVFLTGDFNSYTMEDPLQILEDAGYTNVAQTLTDEETYQFDGNVGSLDHVFASPGAFEDVEGADIWNINAYESVGREYSRYNANKTNLYNTSAYRASDHDPILVGIGTEAAPVATSVAATAERYRYGTRGAVDVTVTADDDSTPSGEVQLYDDETQLGTAVLDGGAATIRIGRTALSPGRHHLDVRYAGAGALQPSHAPVTVRVTKAVARVAARHVAPKPVRAGVTRAKVAVTVRAKRLTPDGRVEVRKAGRLLGRGTLDDGVVTVTLKRFAHPGTKHVTVRYRGSDIVKSARTRLSIKVVRR